MSCAILVRDTLNQEFHTHLLHYEHLDTVCANIQQNASNIKKKKNKKKQKKNILEQ